MDFPCEDIVIEVLETCEPTDALFTALSELVRQGYVLALDDFEPSPDWARFYPLVSVIKLDVQTLPFRHCTQIIQRLKGTGIVFLAEKVETYQEFHQAIKCGFSLFQGYFFQKPEVIRRKKIASSTLDLFKLSSLVSKRNIDHSAVNVVISRNPVFSVQLLKFVNAGVLLRTPIKDNEQSLHYLGDDRIRKFVSYTAISALAPGKPDVLLYHSLQRAKCLEALAGVTEGSCDPASAYLCGLMSLVDGMLDMPLEAILAQLAIAPNIVEALTERRGRLGDFLRVVEALERSDWPKLPTQAQLLSMDEEQILSCHYLASEWASEVQQRA
ncbi:EAL and HDOD domain-containing protein [Vibrio coralliilyticus]|uniref:EAL and HDOD domain-containing protein n=1 Tax=Vibrio coralliilyticus TaxID=190893 RepID=UPI0020A5CC05|nr:HDOD domain-containing protein [Vibrio coralliilyticus]